MIEKNWLDLKKPDELEIKQSEYNPSQAVIEVGPFERGFGVTIGNALRRVLLSSLQGSATPSPGPLPAAWASRGRANRHRSQPRWPPRMPARKLPSTG